MRSRWLGGALALSLLVGLGVLGLRAERPATTTRALSPQNCVTRCQTRQTDCILACDGDVRCEKACVAEGTRCVRRCMRRPDAGVEPSP